MNTNRVQYQLEWESVRVARLLLLNRGFQLTPVTNPEIPAPRIPNFLFFAADTNTSSGCFCSKYATPSNHGPIGSATSAKAFLL